MRDLLTHLMEADVFKPATEEEVGQRQEAAKAIRDARRRELEKKLGRKLDTCPKCGVDLRDEENGIYADVTEYTTETLYYEEKYESWEYGDSDTHDSETTGYHCNRCDGDLKRGRDFDYQEEGRYEIR